MFRRFLPIAAFVALFSVGCVPVTEPVGDITKAEADKSMVGTWIPPKNEKDGLKIELAPEVKGNPKGLMRMVAVENKKDEAVWFFVTTVGKEKYGNICMDAENKKDSLNLGKEGEYERWSKGKGRVYFVFKYSTGKDELTLNIGDDKAFKTIAEDAKLPLKHDIAFDTPSGWLAKYIDKNGGEKIFPAGKDEKLTRAKK